MCQFFALKCWFIRKPFSHRSSIQCSYLKTNSSCCIWFPVLILVFWRVCVISVHARRLICENVLWLHQHLLVESKPDYIFLHETIGECETMDLITCSSRGCFSKIPLLLWFFFTPSNWYLVITFWTSALLEPVRTEKWHSVYLLTPNVTIWDLWMAESVNTRCRHNTLKTTKRHRTRVFFFF